MYLNFLIIQKTKEIKFHNEIFIEEKIQKLIKLYIVITRRTIFPFTHESHY